VAFKYQKFALISCVKKKLPHKTEAQHLYISPFFKKSLQFAKNLNPSGIFILSAKHGLLDLETVIEPYELTLTTMPTHQRKAWAKQVIQQLQKVADIQYDHFTILAGSKYREFLLPHLTYYETPLAGMGIGQQLQFLTNQIERV
jgi:hypothetical protein